VPGARTLDAVERARLKWGSVACAGLLGTLALIAMRAPAATARCASSRAAITYRPGGPELARHRPKLVPCRFNTEAISMEPSFAFRRSGRIFFQAWGTDQSQPGGVPPVASVLRSGDDGRTWRDVTPQIAGEQTHPQSFDPNLIVDPRTGRIYTVNWFGQGSPVCSALSYSDDAGRSWTTSPLACGGFDGETVTTGRPVSSHPIGYPNLVYYCTGTTPGSSPPLSTPECSKSLDGGLTFAPTGTPPFPLSGAEDVYGPWAGNPVVGPDGTLYVPKRFAELPQIAISRDEGVSWKTVAVADNGSASEANRVAADDHGRLYYTWIADDQHPYLAVSSNHGRSWGAPMDLAPRGLRRAALPVVGVGPDGTVAAAYVGTTDAPKHAPEYEPCNVHLSDCTDGPYGHTTWNGYLTQLNRPSDPSPLLRTALVNSPRSALFKGGCAPEGQCKALLDFLDVEFDNRGEPWAAYVDDCRLRRRFEPVFTVKAGRCRDGVGEGFLSRLTPR
jgi:hypothetical protein